MIADLAQDIRYGLRSMRRTPGVTAVIVVTLALGIGANTTIFSLVSAIMLRPLPGVTRPEQLVSVNTALSYPNVLDYRAESRALSALAARRLADVDVRIGEETRRTTGALVTSNYFAVLGVVPVLGRSFTPEEEAGPPGAHPVVIIGYRLWRDRLAGIPNVIGMTVSLNRYPFTVIGVAPEAFRGGEPFETEELWVPLDMFRDVAPGVIAGVGVERWPVWLNGIGRLSADARLADVQAQFAGVARRVALVYPEERGKAVGISATTDLSILVPYLGVLSGIVGAVLLMGCINVANMLLARGSARRREFAVRSALGASRGRLVRQLLLESLLLALTGAAAGLVLTWWATDELLGWLRTHMDDFPAWLSIAPDARVLAFAVALAFMTSLLFGAAPATQLSRPDLVTGLKDGVPAGGRAGAHFRQLLVGIQVAASVVLLAATGTLVTALHRRWAAMQAVAPNQVLQVWLHPVLQRYSVERAKVLYADLLQRVRALPGTQAAALARNGLPWDKSFFALRLTVEHPAGGDSIPGAGYDVVSPGYFTTLGKGLLRGRDFTELDRVDAPGVAIVNETLARRFWPGVNPIGQRLGLPGGDQREVVGLAQDRSWVGGSLAFVYLPLTQASPWERSAMLLHVRTDGNPRELVPLLRREVAALDPTLPVFQPRTVADAIRDVNAPERLVSIVLGSAALLALALSAIGLYGVLSYAVTQRVREFGVRAALGADRRDVLGLVLKEGMTTTAWGLAIGSAVALLIAPGMLRVSTAMDVPTDPATLLGAALVLFLTGLLACLIPASRAVRVDPVVTLRND